MLSKEKLRKAFCSSIATVGFILLSSFCVIADAATTNIILLRHGQTDYNLQGRMQGSVDIPLNATGIAQAEKLGKYLQNTHIDVFISGPLKRANTTAKIVAKYHQKENEVIIDSRIMEMNLGDWGGAYAKDLQAKYPKKYACWQKTPWRFTAPHGENVDKVAKRGAAALTDIAQKYPGKTVLVASHSLLNPSSVCRLLGIDYKHVMQFAQDNASFSVLEYNDGRWKIMTWNAIPHFDKLAKNIPLSQKD